MDPVRPDAGTPAPSVDGASLRDEHKLGDLLIREGLLTEAQLQQALRAQEDVGPSRRLLGQLLIEEKMITREQLAGVLDRYGRRRLGEILVLSKAITQDQLDFAIEHQRRTGLRLGDIFVKLNFVTEGEMKQALCAQLGIPFVDLDNMVLDRQLTRVIDAEYARTRAVIPVAALGDILTVAMDDPTDQAALQALQATTGRSVEVVTSTRAAFRRAFEWMYGAELDASVETATRLEFLTGDTEDPLADIPSTEEIQRADEVVRQLIALAMRWRSSDIHLEKVERRVRARFRIDGVLQELNLGPIEEVLDKFHREIMSRIRILASMNIAERRRPQDGSFRARLAESSEFVKVNFRVSIIPGYFGESVVLRIFDPRNMPKWVQQIGFSKALLDQLLAILGRQSGLFLITGPTGCGKSTSLYTLLNTIARPEIRILTAEDPIEYVFENFSQFEVSGRVGNTYASYLRAFLHHDPEVVMLGEIRDEEAAEMAFRAAQTGHLLFTTLHTNDAVGSVSRLVDLKVPRPLVAATLLGVLAQRLVRYICLECREEYTPAQALVQEFFGAAPPPLRWFRGRGCARCNFTGYKGRFAVGELWTPGEPERTLVASGATFEELRAAARPNTLVMAADVREKLVAGRTNLEELKRILPPHSIGEFGILGSPAAA